MPCLSEKEPNLINIIYIIAAAVDPVEPEHVLEALESYPDYKLSM
jgi:hypothetical protein